MAIKVNFFDNTIFDYFADDFNQSLNSIVKGSGVCGDSDLSVIPNSPNDFTVKVTSGKAWSNGYFINVTEETVIEIPLNASSTTLNKHIVLEVVPQLTTAIIKSVDTVESSHLLLATVSMTNTDTTVKVSNISDKRLILRSIVDWSKFLNNGGTIGGDLSLRRILRSQGLFLQLLTESGFGITIDDNAKRIIPVTSNEITIGSDSYRFKDLFLGDYSKSANGYTKLPNGMIAQWGIVSFSGTATTRYQVTLPISFPNGILSAYTNVNFDVNTVKATVYFQNSWKTNIIIHSNWTGATTIAYNYFVIGY